MMQIGAGISALLVRGQIAYAVPQFVSTMGAGSVGGIPWIVVVLAVFLLAGHPLRAGPYTRIRPLPSYMVGGNREAAEYSGVNVKLVLGAVIVISGVCSGVAGCWASPISAAPSRNEFDGYLLDAIAAVGWWAAPACSAAGAASATPSSAS